MRNNHIVNLNNYCYNMTIKELFLSEIRMMLYKKGLFGYNYNLEYNIKFSEIDSMSYKNILR